MKKETTGQTGQGNGCLSRFLDIVRFLGINPKQSETISSPVTTTVTATISPKEATNEPLYQYAHPELIPSQKYYDPEEIKKREAKKQNSQQPVYKGPDLRGG